MGVFGARTSDRRGAARTRAPEALLSAHEDVAHALQDGRSSTERLHKVLGIACRTLSFDFAAVWRPSADGRDLRCAAVWHRPDASLAAVATASLGQRFAPGRGVPGYVWHTGAPAWVPAATWDPRLAGDHRPPLQSAVAIPIGSDETFEGVLELLCVDGRDREEGTLRFAKLVAAQLAPALAAWRSRDALARRDRALVSADSAVAVADATAATLPLVYVNPAFERLTGYRTNEVIDRPSDLLLGADSDPEASARLASAARAGREAVESLLVYRKDGTPFWDEVTVSPVVDRDGRVAQVVVVHRDVTDERIAADEEEHLAGHDPVTGLANRTLLHAALDRVVERAGRYGLQVALVALALDDGDDDLTLAGRRVEAAVRPGDLVARHGERDLAIVMADLDPDQAVERAMAVAQRLEAAVERPCTLAVTLLAPGEATPVALLERAQAALA